MSAVDDRPHITYLYSWHQVGSQAEYAAIIGDEPPFTVVSIYDSQWTSEFSHNFIIHKLSTVNVIKKWHKNLATSKGVFDLYIINNTLTRKKHSAIPDVSSRAELNPQPWESRSG